MSIFTSKKKKLEIENAKIAAQKQAEVESKRLKQLENKMNAKRNLAMFKKQLAKFDEYKSANIEKAKKAALIGNSQMYNAAKTSLKVCLSRQRHIESMIDTLETALQMNNMNALIGDFVKGINLMASQMQPEVSVAEMAKTQAAYQDALEKSAEQSEALESFISESTEVFDPTVSTDNVTDEEIDKLIATEAANSVAPLDSDIDEKIASIQKKLSE